MLGLGLGLQKSTRVGGFIGLLDLFPNAAAAYSLRKLRAAYSGSAVRVRKEVSSVSSETDIGFLGDGSLDTTTLLTFASDADGGDVFVVTWYDQSLSNDATQSTAASQPKIVSSGAVITDGTSAKPAIQSLGAQVLQTATGVLGVTSELTAFSVLKYDTTGQSNDFAYGITSSAYGATDDNFSLRQRFGNFQSLISDSSNSSELNNGSVDTNEHLISHVFEASTAIKLRNNGVEVSDVTSIPASLNLSKKIEVFSTLGTIASSSMKYQELVFYKSLPAIAPIESNLNSFYSIYP